MKHLFRYVRLIVAFVVFIEMIFISYEMLKFSDQQQQRKYDYANLNHMQYSLFNVDIWNKKLTHILLKEIEEFKLDKSNTKALKTHVQVQLTGLIDKVDQQIRQINEKTTTGWIKQKLMEIFVNIDDIKDGVPNYTDTIVKEMTKSKVQRQLKDVIKKKASQYMKKTFSRQDTSEIDAIIKRYGAKNKKDTLSLLKTSTGNGNQLLFYMMWILLGLSSTLFIAAGFYRKRLPPALFCLCLGTLLILLIVGITCPMIDMDAKVVEFKFSLIGYSISFENMNVFFQSKSLLDVFSILISDPDFKMKVVGVLIITFSVFFPILKLTSSVFYYYNVGSSRKNIFVRFLVLKSGKWSMTDVQIVAIMMAYIGFNGMIKNQFEVLRSYVPKHVFISTNATQFQVGFYIFFAYVIFALFFSIMIEKNELYEDKGPLEN